MSFTSLRNYPDTCRFRPCHLFDARLFVGDTNLVPPWQSFSRRLWCGDRETVRGGGWEGWGWGERGGNWLVKLASDHRARSILIGNGSSRHPSCPTPWRWGSWARWTQWEHWSRRRSSDCESLGKYLYIRDQKSALERCDWCDAIP